MNTLWIRPHFGHRMWNVTTVNLKVSVQKQNLRADPTWSWEPFKWGNGRIVGQTPVWESIGGGMAETKFLDQG